MKKNGVEIEVKRATMPEHDIRRLDLVGPACDRFFAKRGLGNIHAFTKRTMWSNRRKTK